MTYRCGFIEANRQILSEKNRAKDKSTKDNTTKKDDNTYEYLSLPSWLLKNDNKQND